MKKFLSFWIVLLIVFLSFSQIALAANDSSFIEYYGDGSYGITTLKTEKLFFDSKGTKTRTKEFVYYDSDDTELWSASITATFTYNGTTAICTYVSKSTPIKDSSWRCTAASCNKSGATATGNFTFKKYFLGVTVQTVNKTLTLTCSPNGTIT